MVERTKFLNPTDARPRARRMLPFSHIGRFFVNKSVKRKWNVKVQETLLDKVRERSFLLHFALLPIGTIYDYISGTTTSGGACSKSSR